MTTPVLKDWDAQMEEKKVGKSSTGWWAFIPWKNAKLKSIYDKMIAEGLTKSGKWREKQLKDFCRDHEWFMHEVQDCLKAIYEEDHEPEEEVEDEETFEALAAEEAALESTEVSENDQVVEDIQEEKPKTKKSKAKTA
jgi:hypothetical protein